MQGNNVGLSAQRHTIRIFYLVFVFYVFIFILAMRPSVAGRRQLIARVRPRDAQLRAERARAETDLAASRGALAELSKDVARHGAPDGSN